MSFKAPEVTPNMVFFVSFALFGVWMQRNKRWALMIHTMDGTYKIRPKGSATVTSTGNTPDATSSPSGVSNTSAGASGGTSGRF